MPDDQLLERARYEPLRSTPPDPISDALETFPYGVYIIGSRSEAGELNGMLADWTLQVSFKPRLLVVSFENDATTLKNVRATNVFTVNMLAADGAELARNFAQPRDASKVKGRSEEESAKVYDKMAERHPNARRADRLPRPRRRARLRRVPGAGVRPRRRPHARHRRSA